MSEWESTQPRRGLLGRSLEHLRPSSVVGALLGALLVAAVAGVVALLLTPETFTQRIPGDDALGTPAVGNYKAARDYLIVDAEATREARAAAAAAERPVYTFDDAAAEDAAARLREAFARRRAEVPEPRVGEGRRRETSEGRRGASSARAELERELGVALREEDVATLSAASFSEALEGHLVALVNHGLAGRVVGEDRSRLAAARGRGIVTRSLRGGVQVSERVLADVGLVRDLDEARADVERAAAALPAPVTPRERAALGRVAAALTRPTLVFDGTETTARQREAVEKTKPVVIQVKRGEKVVGDGEVIEERHLTILRGIRAQTRATDVVVVRLAAATLVAALVLLLWRHARRNVLRFRPRRKDAVLLALALLGTAGLAAAGHAVGDALHDRFPRLGPDTFFYLVPFAAGTLVVRCVLSVEVALLFAVASGAVVGLVAGGSHFIALQATLTAVVASGLVSRTRDRAGLFRVGLGVGVVGAVLVAAAQLFAGGAAAEAIPPAVAALAGGAVVLPVVVVGMLPIIEWAFVYLTDVKLLELANLNHPALKDLIVQAPGTYHHSVIMGAIVEAAAAAIGANPLLAKVCAYYHDIGKIRNPLYFAENQRADNRHDTLAPSMSALVVKRHVTDGIELARHWGLPRAVADAIPEHHGTRLVSFFWAQARQRAADAPDGEGGAVDESLFRYPGPKPQSRETALVMIADACEASARALPEPTSQALRALVHKRINEIFGEGQLDECELTLRDLNAIAGAVTRALEGVYHARPDYPAAQPGSAGPGPQLQLVGKGTP